MTGWLGRMNRLLVLCLAACVSLLVGCGGTAPRDASLLLPPPERDPAEWVEFHRQEIRRLSAQPAASIEEAEPYAGSAEPCASTCEVANQICHSADTICAIADEHGTEADFRTTCTWARAVCSDAQTDCRRCR